MHRSGWRLALLVLCFFAAVPTAPLRAQEATVADGVPLAEPAAPDGAFPEASEASETPSAASAGLAAGAEEWRAGRRTAAEQHWRAALDRGPSRAVRAALYYNLGNGAWHRDRALEAVGWYTLALPLAPREPDLLDNLDLARREAGLAPRDRGDLVSTFERYLTAWTEAESRWLALLGLLPFAVALLGEALRGGAGWRMTALATLLVAVLAALPLWNHERRDGRDLGLVLAPAGARLAAEPGSAPGSSAQGPLAEAGSEVERIDSLPDWVRVRTESGQRGWIPASDFFALRR